jgi:hypothetical protein
LTLGGYDPPRFGRTHGRPNDFRTYLTHASAPAFSHRHTSAISDRQFMLSTQSFPYDSL